MATRADEQITLAGPPRSTSAVVRLAAGGARVATVALELKGGVAMHKAYLRRFGEDATELRLRLPRETPPGSYRAEVALGDRRTAITVVVDPVLHVRVHPQRTRISAPAAGTVEFALAVENRGNIACDIPKGVTLDLDEIEGQGRALGRSLRATLAPGEQRVDRFFEELRGQHGGEARLVVIGGGGPLQPAEARELRCQLELPDSITPGRSYVGGWQLGDAAHVLEVDVNHGKPVIREGRPQ